MQKEKHDVVITKNDLKYINYVVCNLTVPLVKDYKKIEELIQKRIEGTISEEEYQNGYKDVINETKIKIIEFNNKFKELYILNKVNKTVNNSSINIYENVNFDSILLGINQSLKINIIPINIFDSILNFDVSSLLHKFKNKNIKFSIKDISTKNQQYIKYIENKINNYNTTAEKVYSKK